jgi:hypothetical protein
MSSRRDIAFTAAALFLACRLSAQDAMRFADEAAHNLFVRSRAAVVQTGSVQRLRGLLMKGQLRQFTADGGLLEGQIEIRALLPDHFIRIETFGASKRISGFAGRVLLTEMRDGNRVELPPENLTGPLLRMMHTHFTRLMLGAAMYVTADQELTFRSAGAASAMVDPRTTARAAIGSGGPSSAAAAAIVTNATPEPFAMDVMSDSFNARCVVDGATGMPVRLVFPGANKEPNTMKFEDRRLVSGLNLPYRITVSTQGRAIETMVFDEIVVNPELSKADFRSDPKK